MLRRITKPDEYLFDEKIDAINLSHIVSYSIKGYEFENQENTMTYFLYANVSTLKRHEFLESYRPYQIIIHEGTEEECQKELDNILREEEEKDQILAKKSGMWGAIAGAITGAAATYILPFLLNLIKTMVQTQ